MMSSSVGDHRQSGGDHARNAQVGLPGKLAFRQGFREHGSGAYEASEPRSENEEKNRRRTESGWRATETNQHVHRL